MKRCDVFADCGYEQYLVLNLDLRVELEKRLAEVARVIVPLKEGVGMLHVSTSLAYQENGVTKYCNLPVCVTEDEQERVVRLLFPAGLNVTIWTDEAEKVINGLEYHVDKHTEVVTEVINDLNTIQPIPGRIQLSVNMRDITENEGLNSDAILNSLEAQVRQVRDWNQPIDLVLYMGRGENYLMPEMLEVQRNRIGTQLHLLIRARRPNDCISTIGQEIMELSIGVDGDKVDLVFFQKTAFVPNLVFLYEDCNGVISLLDNDKGWSPARNWEWFSSMLKAGQRPAVYLCSPNSGGYCPVYYQVFQDEAGAINGVLMETSYYREVDGHLELWTERRNFDGLPETSATYFEGYEEPLRIRKVVLGTIQ